MYVARRVAPADWAWRVAASLAVVATLATGGPGAVTSAVAGSAALVGYQTWYTDQHRPSGGLAVGELLPAFALQTADGSPTTSEALRASPHVILFYRGSWCPFCVAQVRELAAQYRELDRRGVHVALISPQPADDTRALAERFDVPMDFYVDHQGSAARALDIVQQGGVPLSFTAGTDGDTVVPTAIVTDAVGRVVWFQHADDHRVRPEPATFLEVIDRAGIGARGGA
ncbi:peroxiredoxin-like family protein [Kineosporia sp. A_224]|uniref:peroxiredoxin-like family protein n=1 Tax=Kineosporia sp. A_224 TaxID=1962180 RepID=UPI001E4B8128|nr:peroxiredoxin-like family protein [Kineosporia sp. A_224]